MTEGVNINLLLIHKQMGKTSMFIKLHWKFEIFFSFFKIDTIFNTEGLWKVSKDIIRILLKQALFLQALFVFE